MNRITFGFLILLALAGIFSGCAHNSVKARQEALQKGQQFYKKAAYGDAEIQFRKALQEDPRFGEALYWLGLTKKQRGDYAAAVDNLNRAIALWPGQNAPKVELVNILLLLYLVDPSRPGELHDRISTVSEELLQGGVDSFDGVRLKGYLALADGNAKKAVDYFEEANRVKPNEPDVIAALVESLGLDNQAPLAEQVARGFLRGNPGCGPVYTILYQHYMATHRYDEAEALLKEKIANNPKEIQYRIEIARHYARTGQPQKTTETLNQLLENHKQFPDALLPVADFYAESRNWEEARRLYERGLEAEPKNKAIFWKRLVRVDLGANDRAGALRLLEQVLKEHPDDSEAKASHAALLMAGKDAPQQKLASEEFKSLVGQFPGNAVYHLQYAEALRSMGDADGAQAQYMAVLQKQPTNMAVLQSLADLSIRRQRFEDALGYARRVLALDPSSARALLVESAALAGQRKFAETRAVLTELIQENPNLREAQFQFALLEVEEKRYAEAEKRFLKYYQPGKGDTLALEGLVELYRAQEQNNKAIALLQQDLQKNPGSNEVRRMLADLAEGVGQYDLAIAQYELLSRAQPESAAVWLRLGLSYQKKHDAARAVEALDRAGKMDPQNALIFGYLGQALDEAGRRAEAITADRRSLTLDNRNPWVMNNLAFLLADTGGDLNAAMKLALDAVRVQPDEVSFSDTLGWVYLKKGDASSAAHVFESVREKRPRDVTFRIHLAMALLASGELNKSRSELTAAQQLPASPEEKSSISRLLDRIGPNRP